MSHTLGTKRLMMVGISMNPSGESVSSVTYNGINLTHVGFRKTALLWHVSRMPSAPDTGTHDVVVNFTDLGHKGASVGVMTFTRVDQTTALGAFSGNSGLSASASTRRWPRRPMTSSLAWLRWKRVRRSHRVQATEYWDIDVNADDGAGTIEAGAASVTTHPGRMILRNGRRPPSPSRRRPSRQRSRSVQYGRLVSGNDGTQNWTGDWQELGESNGASSGKVMVISSPDALRIGGGGMITNDGALREVDLSMAGTLIRGVPRSASRAASVRSSPTTVEPTGQICRPGVSRPTPALQTFESRPMWRPTRRSASSARHRARAFLRRSNSESNTQQAMSRASQVNNTGSSVAEGGRGYYWTALRR